jgi:hypothetical protein
MPETAASPDTDSNALPRPDTRGRTSTRAWINLNGRWRFSFDPQNAGEQMRWYR